MTINCKGTLVDLTKPKVMGILNVTPDSFFDGGRYADENKILERVAGMLEDGATFIDLGAYSSRPGADFVSEAQELERIVPIVELLVRNFPEILLSIDTFRSNVAKETISAGAAIINDIAAGGLDSEMMKVVGALKVPYIMMHMKGNPNTMQQLASYSDLTQEVLEYFSHKISEARSYGIDDSVLDPGFGFAKTLAHNYELMSKVELLHMAGLPLLVGVSRKSMVYKLLNVTPAQALNGTTVLHTIALQKGAQILRVHDVKQAMECIAIINHLNANKNE